MNENSIPPWKKPAPKKRQPIKLTAQSKARAKATAQRAGRAYPNLVDNMNAAKLQRQSSAKKKSAKGRAKTRAESNA